MAPGFRGAERPPIQQSRGTRGGSPGRAGGKFEPRLDGGRLRSSPACLETVDNNLAAPADLLVGEEVLHVRALGRAEENKTSQRISARDVCARIAWSLACQAGDNTHITHGTRRAGGGGRLGRGCPSSGSAAVVRIEFLVQRAATTSGTPQMFLLLCFSLRSLLPPTTPPPLKPTWSPESWMISWPSSSLLRAPLHEKFFLKAY